MTNAFFRLMPYVFLVEGKVRGALYDLHAARIFPIPEALTRVLALCEKGTPRHEVKAWAGAENGAAVDDYFARLTKMGFGRFYTDLDTYEKVGLQLSRLRLHAVDVLTICPGSGPSDLTLERWLQLLRAFKQHCGSFNLRLILDGRCEQNLVEDLLADEVLAKFRVSLLVLPSALEIGDPTWMKRLGQPIQQIPEFPDVLQPGPPMSQRRLVSSLESFRHLSALNINANRLFIQADGRVFSCYHHRDLCLGSLAKGEPLDLVDGSPVQRFWGLTKDKIDVCRDCEFRYGCPNPQRGTGPQLTSAPSNCGYSPETGAWKLDRLWQFFERAVAGASTPEVDVLETTHFRVFSSRQHPFPDEYLRLLTEVVERAADAFGLEPPSQPITYCYYPRPSDFPDMVVEAAGGVMEATPVGDGFRMVIHTCLPCHTHEILHALLHPLQPVGGSHFVREAAATVLGLADGLGRHWAVDPLAGQRAKLTLPDGSPLPADALLLDRQGLISGPLRADPHVHAVAAGLMARGHGLDLDHAFSVSEIKDLAMYLMGGSFLHFLKDRRGVDAFLRFYRSDQTMKDLPHFQQLRSQWIEMLKERGNG